MLTNITGIYRGGKVEFKELPMNIPDETQVVVTFIGRGHINLQARGINQAQAEELRSKKLETGLNHFWVVFPAACGGVVYFRRGNNGELIGWGLKIFP
jgi:hypothetical protein